MGFVKRVGELAQGLLLGLALAYGFHHAILIDLGVDDQVLRWFRFVVAAVLGVSCAASREVQCVGLICCTMFCSRSGRRTVQAMLLALLITGPGHNMIRNTREVVRSFGCAAQLASNVSREYAHLTVQPFRAALLNLDQREADAVSKAVGSVQDQILPLKEKMQFSADSKDQRPDGEKMEKNFAQEVQKECEAAIQRSSDNCKQVFAGRLEQCEEEVSAWVSWLLCWPLKLDHACDLGWMLAGKAPCAPRDLNPGFGGALGALPDRTALRSTLGKATVRFRTPPPDLRLDVRDAVSSAENIEAEVRAKALAAHLLLGLFAKVVALLFLPTILESVKFANNFLQRPAFENHFLSQQLRLVDAKRLRQGRTPTLLPLRKAERRHLVDLATLLPNGPEKGSLLSPSLFRILLLCLVVAAFFSTDHLFFRTLQIVAKHGHFHLTLTGNHTLHVRVHGSGFAAKLVRSLTKGFDQSSDAFLNRTLTNEHCLPRPAPLQMYYKLKTFVLLMLMVLFLLGDYLPKRVRHLICAFYFPKREKQRSIFLYNKLLKMRFEFKHNAKKTLMDKIREMKRSRRYEKKGSSWPARVLSFVFRRRVKKKCSLCSDTEQKKEQFVRCRVCPNDLYFCVQCWEEINCKCLICRVRTEVN